jgi:hypothetical protein
MKNLITFALLAILSLSSCKKNLEDKFNETNESKNTKAKNTSELVVAENFNWETSKITNLKLIANENYPAVIYSLEGELVAKTMVLAGKENLVPITLASTQKQVRVVFMDKEYIMDINSENVTIQLF